MSKQYDVVILMTVIKTYRVEADTEDEATEIAHQDATTANEEGMPEKYDQETLDVVEVKGE